MPRSMQDVAQSIKRAQNRHHRALEAALAPIGLTLVQWDALRHLNRNPDSSLHDLAQLIYQSDQAFGTLSTRMADRGLVQRVTGAGRAIRLQMTPKGRELLAKGAKVVDGVLADSFTGLSARQLDQLGALLDQVMRADD